MKTFEPNTTITELGIDITRKFVVVNGDEIFTEGSILTLLRDDDSTCPYFKNENGGGGCIFLKNLAYYEEEPKEEMKEGDYVYVSAVSEEDALEYCRKRILLRKCNNGVVTIGSESEKGYREGYLFNTEIWKHATPAPKTKIIAFEVTEEQEREINLLLNK